MRLAEKILLFLSRDSGRDASDGEDGKLDNSLSLLEQMFPEFLSSVANKRIVDFGCGPGNQSVALAMSGAAYVLGIDTNPRALERARELSRTLGVADKVEFAGRSEDKDEAQFDMVISQNSMEHFADPAAALKQMKCLAGPNGKIFMTFGPPWYSPYGSHMNFFTKVPWVNILFSERTVMNVRSHFRHDGATRYEEVTGGLNKMTVAMFERVIADSGIDVEFKKYNCVLGLNFLGRVPLLRELFTYQISFILSPQ